MEGQGRGKQRGSVERDTGRTSSKRHKKLMDEVGERLFVSRREAGMADVVDQWDDASSSSESEYMAEQSSSGESVSLEVEWECTEDVGGGSGSQLEGRRSKRGTQRSSVPKMKVLWKTLKKRT